VRARGSWAALLVGFALSACASGPAPRDHFYRIQPGPAAPVATPLPGTLEVERFSSSDTLRERGILRTTPGSPSVTPYSYHRWVDSPTLLLQRALAGYLRDAGMAENVVTAEAGAPDDWQVGGHIHRLDHVVGEDSSVRVELELRARRSGTETLIVHELYASEHPADDPTPEAAARAFSSAVGEIFAAFGRDLHAAGMR
jgi:ABC-type uncharacterized transport system auxiliary subunit